jgi:hypothetical protein
MAKLGQKMLFCPRNALRIPPNPPHPSTVGQGWGVSQCHGVTSHPNDPPGTPPGKKEFKPTLIPILCTELKVNALLESLIKGLHIELLWMGMLCWATWSS